MATSQAPHSHVPSPIVLSDNVHAAFAAVLSAMSMRVKFRTRSSGDPIAAEVPVRAGERDADVAEEDGIVLYSAVVLGCASLPVFCLNEKA
jgi:hypothetical protein